MALITLAEAKQQLNITDTNDDAIITELIDVAQGIIEQEIQRDIYDLRAQVPITDLNALAVDELRPSKQAALQMAVKLVLSSLFLYRESELDVNLSANPAFKACLSGFSSVYVG